MSSVVVSTSAATSRLFVFDEETNAEARPFPGAHKKPAGTESDIAQGVQSTIKNQQSKIAASIGNRKSAIENSILPASQLAIRPAPEMVSSGIPALDALTGGLPRGCLTEICGPASSGRTTLLLAALAVATRRGEFCALVDANDALDPQSVAAAGVQLDWLLWVRCGESSPRKHPSTSLRACPFGKLRAGSDTERNSSQTNSKARDGSRNTNQTEQRLEQVLRATDLLLESGGFGLIVLDLADLPVQTARRIPLTTWFRFRRTVEHTPTILLAIEQQPIAGSCSSLRLQLSVASCQLSVLSSQNTVPQQAAAEDLKPPHAQLLTGLEITAELIRSRLSGAQFSDISSPLKTYPNRKPAGSGAIAFASKTAWG